MRTRISLLVAGFLVAATGLCAATANAVTIIPPNLEFSVQPGETITTKVKLFNESADTLTQYSSVANFVAKDETGTPEFVTETDVSDLASWMTVEPGPFNLSSGDRLEIPVTIAVPADAEPGGHYAAVFFSGQAPDAAAQQGQIGIAAKVGSLILVRVAGDISERATIAEFGSDGGETVYNRLPVDFVLRMQNQGNVHVRPTGTITIRNIIGGTTRELVVNPTLGAVLPASTRRFDMTWERTAVDEKTSFFKEFANEWNNFAFGPYTANLVVTYGIANDKTATATYSFWVLPWRVLLTSVILIILVIWGISWLVGRYNMWIVKKASSGKPQKK